MDNKNTVIGIVAAVILLAIIGWYAGWFGSKAPIEATAPATTTEQPAVPVPATPPATTDQGTTPAAPATPPATTTP